MGKSLKQVLTYDGDVEEAMDLTFAVEYEYFGAIRTYELKPGGKDIPVTKDSREGQAQRPALLLAGSAR